MDIRRVKGEFQKDGREGPIRDAPASVVFELEIVVGKDMVLGLGTRLPGRLKGDGIANKTSQFRSHRKHGGHAPHAHYGVVRGLVVGDILDGAVLDERAQSEERIANSFRRHIYFARRAVEFAGLACLELGSCKREQERSVELPSVDESAPTDVARVTNEHTAGWGTPKRAAIVFEVRDANVGHDEGSGLGVRKRGKKVN